jgi:ribonuclease/clavin/mitogillin
LTCKPTTDKSKTKFKVDAKLAKSQAAVAGFTPGKSGDPHRFHNGEGLPWGVSDCDKSGATLWEYPIYWMGAPGSSKGKAVWDKDSKSSKQQSTPIRVVYAEVSNKAVYCGVMIHGTVEASFQGKGSFVKCT